VPASAADSGASPATAPQATTPHAAGPPCNVALIGDSITDYRSHGGDFVRYLERHCPASHFENFAKGGAMVNQMRARFEATLASEPKHTFSHVVVFGGVNDLYSDETAGRTTQKIETDLSALYAGARALGARVVAITVAPWGGFTRYFTPHRAETTRELNAWILAQTADGSVDTVVDAFSLLACGDPDRLCERYERARSDGLHFGSAGHEVLGRALYEQEFQRCP
jgi:lysophospholipase L1-like esterase